MDPFEIRDIAGQGKVEGPPLSQSPIVGNPSMSLYNLLDGSQAYLIPDLQWNRSGVGVFLE